MIVVLAAECVGAVSCFRPFSNECLFFCFSDKNGASKEECARFPPLSTPKLLLLASTGSLVQAEPIRYLFAAQ